MEIFIRDRSNLTAWLLWFGVIVGSCQVTAGVFPLGYAIFVDLILIDIPALPSEVIEKIPVNTPANIFLHRFPLVDSLMGVLPLLVWPMLIGVKLLGKEQTDL